MNTVFGLVVKRIGLGILTLFVISIIFFIGVEALPGDLAEEILGQNALPETVAAFRKEFKLDLPPHERYVAWLGDLLKGDLGKSLANGRPVVDLIGWRFANTVFLHLPCSFRPQVKSWGSKTRRLIGNLMALERPNAGGLSLKPPLFT